MQSIRIEPSWKNGKTYEYHSVIKPEREPNPSSSTIRVVTLTTEVISLPRKKRKVIHTRKSKGCHICGKDGNRCFWNSGRYKLKKRKKKKKKSRK